jgi:hypothetical protein
MGEKRKWGNRRWCVVVDKGQQWCVGGGGNDEVVWMWCLEVFRGRRDEDGEKRGVWRWVEGMRKEEEQ